MAPHFIGKKYKMVSHDKFDEYMKALGVNMVLRKVGTSTMSDFVLSEKDGEYTMAITSTFRSQFITFRMGVEVDETTLDHRKVKTVFTLDGNVFTQSQKGDKNTTIVRTFVDDEMRVVMTVDDIVSTIVSKLVNE